ncbi:hypothetical protein K458DRAFT_398964 [Lentithecium fluviatile CBS 122367]|uniref:Uncharacterized protein n=1 Tax=Lentithecium fluviatile CBS 122367 TaxID=1168545 RepID=A0A6G1JLJ5_9PLEO|nr:hypothetical protein K458DRAFT_398964 [Lentithecium fluviatile CBS 122367]
MRFLTLMFSHRTNSLSSGSFRRASRFANAARADTALSQSIKRYIPFSRSSPDSTFVCHSPVFPGAPSLYDDILIFTLCERLCRFDLTTKSDLMSLSSRSCCPKWTAHTYFQYHGRPKFPSTVSSSLVFFRNANLFVPDLFPRIVGVLASVSICNIFTLKLPSRVHPYKRDFRCSVENPAPVRERPARSRGQRHAKGGQARFRPWLSPFCESSCMYLSIFFFLCPICFSEDGIAVVEGSVGVCRG